MSKVLRVVILLVVATALAVGWGVASANAQSGEATGLPVCDDRHTSQLCVIVFDEPVEFLGEAWSGTIVGTMPMEDPATGLPVCPAQPMCIDRETGDGVWGGTIVGTMPLGE